MHRVFFKSRIVFNKDPNPEFLPGSESGFQISLDPDSVFKFLWFRIRFPNFSGSGSQISLDLNPVFKFFWIRYLLFYLFIGKLKNEKSWIRIRLDHLRVHILLDLMCAHVIESVSD